jgi:3-phosphoshikimate 1-carboxyvinyltransferase
VLLAGLFACGETTVVETQRSRDHTERMLGLSAFETGDERHLKIAGGTPIPAQTWTIPGDFSAAAFFLVAASITPGSDVRLPAVGLNPTRAALLDVLRAMGAQIDVNRERTVGGEPVGDLRVRASNLHHVEVRGDLVPIVIDEVPILAVAGSQAEGGVTIRDAAELRVKETDRIAATAQMLRAMGARVDEFEDGLHVAGPAALQGARVDSHGDHRIAMSAAVAALVADGETTVAGADAASVSFPAFYDTLGGLSVG